ncbi:hypothetical protein ACFL13_00210 [Patescibacteria group bacterium]
MPTLSLYFSESAIYTMLQKDDGKKLFDVFHYQFSPYLYPKQEKFNKEVIDILAERHKLPKTDLKISSTHLLDVKFPENEFFYPIMINNLSVSAPSGFHSVFPAGKQLDNMDYLSNLAIFNYISPKDTSGYRVQYELLLYLAQLVPVDHKDLLFMGDFFINLNNNPKKYLLMLDFVRKEGIYNLYFDQNSEYILDKTENFVPKNLGALVVSSGPTVCYIETQVGTKQLFEVEEDDLVFIPLDASTKSRIVVKSANLGTVEEKVGGGVLGVMVDTRKKGEISQAFSKSYAKYISSIQEVLAKI